MLFSMTGFGDARGTARGGAIGLEVRSVNNRHLKVTVRGSDPYPMLEAEVEKVIRRHVKRGTLHVQIRVERTAAPANAKLNTGLMRGYIEQIYNDLKGVSAADRTALIAGVLALPGVAPEGEGASGSVEEEWPAVEKALEAALIKLNAARQTEGEAMAAELRHLASRIEGELASIREHLPGVTGNYRQRLLDRVKLALADAGATLSPEHVIREVALFADRIDVAEEMTRLISHLAAFDDILGKESDSPGRRLEFVIQEMGREANTLGSKAGDVTISRHVVEIKATLEKMRELVQNVE